MKDIQFTDVYGILCLYDVPDNFTSKQIDSVNSNSALEESLVEKAAILI